MRRLLLLLVCWLAVVTPARALAPAFDNLSVNHWMTYYYLTKDVGHVGAMVHWVAGVDFDKNANFSPPATGFLAAVFKDNPDSVRGWVSGMAPNPGAKDVIERALWLSGHADLIDTVFHDTPDYAKENPPRLIALSLDTPGMWDVMWAAFSATGDTAYPARLIDLLDDKVVFSDDVKLNEVYHRTVAWSLESNMSQHELILRIVRREAQRRSGPVQQKLKEMLAKIDAQHVAMPNSDGAFSAMLVLVSEDNLTELDKPFDQGPILKELHEAKPGDHVAVVIVFTGMELADDLSADVTYDLKTVRPDGAVYDSAEHKDLQALKNRVAERFSIYDNRPMFLMISFEPKDPRGTYRVEAVVKDNVGGRKVKLVKEITLKD